MSEQATVAAPRVKPVETFRGDFTYSNSREAIRRFPFPFHRDDYMYSVNIEPHDGTPPGTAYAPAFDIDEHYLSEMAERRTVLEEDPKRCQVLPYMMEAQWDTLELMMTSLAADYPEHFSLTCEGDTWTWENRLLDIRDTFTFKDADTLPLEPFEYITRQVQGDFTLHGQRNDMLYMDGGMVTCQADWSLDFDLGMNFYEWHGPVPRAHEMGVFERALKYLLTLKVGSPIRRLNWTMTVNPRMDTSPENYDKWGIDRSTITPDNVGELAHLRVELQSLWRLPRSNAILFSIRCYLISMEELATVPKWARRFHRVLRDLPEDLADYKGFIGFRPTVLDYLAPFDDGRETSPGGTPD